jgi:general secretion pathway protein K
VASGQVKDRTLADLFADDALSGAAADETGKIPVNALAGSGAAAYGRILRDLLMGPAFKLAEPDATRIVLAVRDWVDADVQPGLSDSLGEDFQKGRAGAEATYYAALDQDHLPPNAPMLSLGELLRVRGITRAMFDGTAGMPGLKDLLTVYGTGTEGLNVNTAPEAVLAALAWKNGESTALAFARDVVDFRSQKGNEALLENPEWVRTTLSAYRNLVLTGVPLASRGTYFSVRLTGAQGAARAGGAAWFKRSSDGEIEVVARQAW